MHHGGANLLLVLGIFVISKEVGSARILGIWGVASKSHTHVFTALAIELAARGHEVLTITPFPVKKKIPNYKEIHLKSVQDYVTTELDLIKNRHQNPFSQMVDILQTYINLCEQGLQVPEVQELIKTSHENKFDLIISSIFFCDCYLGFVHKFNVPLIYISPAGEMFGIHEFVGGIEPWSHVPVPPLTFTDRMNFQQRFVNTLFGIFFKASRWYVDSLQDKIMRQHFGSDVPFVRDIQRNASLMLLNTHVSLFYPRPTMPNMIDVAGMHLKPPKELPQDLKKFLDDAKEGVIYFSLGSCVRGDQLPAEKSQIFLDVFGQLKQKVLWKWESENLPGQPKNIKTGKWLPQQDILAHPNVRVFITHGGLLSTQEAIYHGLPLIGIPIFGDQDLNMQKVASLGIGIKLDFNKLTREDLLNALKTIQQNSSYRENAKRLLAVLKDNPDTPLERAVFWTEYVIRHKGARHLRSGAMDLSVYQYFLLDVFAVLFLILGVVATLVYLSLRTLYRCIKRDKTKVKKS